MLKEDLTKEKTTAITYQEQLTHTHNTLLCVRNSPVCKRHPVNTSSHFVSHVCVAAPPPETLSHLAVVLCSGLFVTEQEQAACLRVGRLRRPPTRPEGGEAACSCSEPGVTNDIFFQLRKKTQLYLVSARSVCIAARSLLRCC